MATYLPSVVTDDGDVMADNRKSDLEQRIEENRQKIEEISAFRDDPKIDKIIRVLQKQIAQDFYQLSLLDQVSQHGDVPRPMYA